MGTMSNNKEHSNHQQAAERSKSYYSKGNEERATVTPLTLQRLEKRDKLTKNSKQLVIVLVGLPARGKSFISRKLQAFLTWSGIHCKTFNVGRYRREAVSHMAAQQEQQDDYDKALAHHDANFFDSKNEKAHHFREYVASLAMQDMLRWLDNEGGGTVGESFNGDDDDDSNGTTGPDSPKRDPAVLAQPELGRRSSSTNASTSAKTKLSSAHWERGHDRIAIFDATNSTAKRRRWILEECTSPAKRPGKPTGVVFVESICDDEALLKENYKYKVSSSPDFEGMGMEEAIEDLMKRVQKYEEQYETLADESQSYIKIYNLSTKLMVNHIYGRMAKTIVPALMAWNIGTRPVFLSRSGYVPSVMYSSPSTTDFLDLSAHTRKKILNKGDSVGGAGLEYRDRLCDFLEMEGKLFMIEREHKASTLPSLNTGTSQTGLVTFKEHTADSSGTTGIGGSTGGGTGGGGGSGTTGGSSGGDGMGGGSGEDDTPFPAKIMTSVMPRAIETALWDKFPFPIETMSNLNPLDKGDFAGMEIEEIRNVDPDFYATLEADPYNTRFPGGESYCDLIRRLESVVIDIEQQIAPVLVVSHVSCLQALVSYFRGSPVDKCMLIEVPIHTVIKFTPSRGGGWIESRHSLLDDGHLNNRHGKNNGASSTSMNGHMNNNNYNNNNTSNNTSDNTSSTPENLSSSSLPRDLGTLVEETKSPIWGDHSKQDFQPPPLPGLS